MGRKGSGHSPWLITSSARFLIRDRCIGVLNLRVSRSPRVARICSDLHTSKRAVVAAFDGGKVTGGHAPTSNHVSRHRPARLGDGAPWKGPVLMRSFSAEHRET